MIVVATWSTLRGLRGVVTQITPYTMVRLDGDDPRPVRVGDREVIPEHGDSAKHVGGAE